jgi:hypothetical protein
MTPTTLQTTLQTPLVVKTQATSSGTLKNAAVRNAATPRMRAGSTVAFRSMALQKFLRAALVASALITSAQAHALSHHVGDRLIDLEKITWGGPGCTGKGEPLSFYYSQRLGRLYVSLPEVAVSAGEKPLDRKACSLALPVELPPGKALVIGHPAVYGEAVILGSSAEGRAQAEVFLAGGQGPTVTRVLSASDGRIRPSFYSRENQKIELACGGSGTVRLNVSALAKTGAPGEKATVVLDGAAVTLQLRDCQ